MGEACQGPVKVLPVDRMYPVEMCAGFGRPSCAECPNKPKDTQQAILAELKVIRRLLSAWEHAGVPTVPRQD